MLRRQPLKFQYCKLLFLAQVLNKKHLLSFMSALSNLLEWAVEVQQGEKMNNVSTFHPSALLSVGREDLGIDACIGVRLEVAILNFLYLLRYHYQVRPLLF